MLRLGMLRTKGVVTGPQSGETAMAYGTSPVPPEAIGASDPRGRALSRLEDTAGNSPKSGLGIQRQNKGKGRASLTDGARELPGHDLYARTGVQGVHCKSTRLRGKWGWNPACKPLCKPWCSAALT